MTGSHEGELHDAIWALHDALQRRDGIEQRLRNGDNDALLFDRGLAASEAVVHARLALYRVLIEQGWTPPPSVANQLHLDARLMTEVSENLI
ncbi:MAG TPA: hypothetical protein VM097_00240 [Mycobacteriales bacterium]|nr:hypothetical protein [Mycobacteriales bacterium]